MKRYRSRPVLSAILGLAALGTSACWWVYSVDGRPRKTRIACLQVKQLEGALQLFHYDTRRFPATADGLDVLVHDPGNIEGWRHSYIDYIDHEIPIDPWGRAYVYRGPGRFGDFYLFSLGRDGLVGGEGEDTDIVSVR